MEERLGAPLPPPNEEMNEDVEVQLSRVIAEAGKQLTQAHQQQAAQQAAQQKAQDPVVQMQQQELMVKQAEVQRKAKKDSADIKLRQAELQLKAAKDKEQLKIDKAELALDAKKEGTKLATDKQDKTDKRNLEILKTMK